MKTKTKIIAALAASAFAITAQAQRPSERPADRNPETLVASLIADFDANEDNALNAEELTAALTHLREQRASRIGNRMPQRGIDSDATASDRPRGRRGPPEPEFAAKRLIEDFDANKDQALDAEELFAAFTSKRGVGGPRKGGVKGGRS